MTTMQIDWKALNGLAGDELKDAVFSLLQKTALAIQTEDIDNPSVLETVPRLANLLESRSELSGFKGIFSSLARSVGLWNYIDKDEVDSRDDLAVEIASVNELGIVLHREQMAAFNILKSGQNLILSAPTSFGKSILIDTMLLKGEYNRVAIVLPTIALLDEFRRRLVKRFGSTYDVLMHHSEQPTRKKVIFLGTQERLINRSDLGTLDLVVVDEFYKLDPTRKDERSVTLNAAVYKLLNRSKQFFFLGPNIENVQTAGDSRWKFSFLRTRFSTVAVDTYDLQNVPDKEERLYKEVASENNWPALVFVSSPDKANKLSAELVERSEKMAGGKNLSIWMAKNYGGSWELSDAVAAGIGVHHGRIPRALASRFITLFNQKKLPVLICTSTLIEGVNTAAKSVLIYDKKIARDNFDFFTFSNIKGRAGRLGQHHVGQVFLFHNPPDQVDVDVSAPLFGDLDDAPDEFVVHIEDEDATDHIAERVDEMAKRVGLEASEIRRYSTLGLEVLVGLRAATNAAMRARQEIQWSGWPTYNQLVAVCSIICAVKPARDFGGGSDRQLAMYISKLRQFNFMKEFYKWYSESYRGEPQRLDNIFKFLRAAEYSLPEYFAVVELFITKAGGRANYSLFLAELPRWFRPETLKNLEEQGVPMQISERFYRKNDTVQQLSGRLRALALEKDEGLTSSERAWILDALPA